MEENKLSLPAHELQTKKMPCLMTAHKSKGLEFDLVLSRNVQIQYGPARAEGTACLCQKMSKQPKP